MAPLPVVLAVAAVLHTGIALVTYRHTHQNFAPSEPSASKDLFLNMLYLTVIDAVLCLCQVERRAVRAWHWKVNTVVATLGLVFTYSDNIPLHLAVVAALMGYVYHRLAPQCEGKVVCVGLEKYMKKATPDYLDVTFSRNARYLFITLAEGWMVYNHYVFWGSAFLWVVIDALWNQVVGVSRTKLSDLYVSIFTASMDTGLHMAIFNYQPCQDITLDVGTTVGYLLLVHFLVWINDSMIKQTYSVINGPFRLGLLFAWTLVAFFAGPYKHALGVYLANLLSNLLFVYTSHTVLSLLFPSRAGEPQLVLSHDACDDNAREAPASSPRG